MTQLLIHIPEDLASKFRALIPSKQRSKYIENILQKNLLEEDNILLKCATQIEADKDINELIADFNNIPEGGVYE